MFQAAVTAKTITNSQGIKVLLFDNSRKACVETLNTPLDFPLGNLLGEKSNLM